MMANLGQTMAKKKAPGVLTKTKHSNAVFLKFRTEQFGSMGLLVTAIKMVCGKHIVFVVGPKVFLKQEMGEFGLMGMLG